MELIFFDRITNGTPSLNWIRKFEQQAEMFDGKDVVISVKKKRKIRSLNQNAYYHGCIIPYYQQGIKEMWDENIGHDQAHEDLKRECNWKEKVNEQTGEVKRFTLSSADLSTIEFELYCERCRRFIQEYFNITVPLPNEQSEFNLA